MEKIQTIEEALKEITKMNKIIKEYRKTMRIPLCEICGKAIESKETRYIIKRAEAQNRYKEYVVQHLHKKCWELFYKMVSKFLSL